MDDTIDISNIPKPALLIALYNGAKQQGFGLLNAQGRDDLTNDDAVKMTDTSLRFDYVRGRVLKVNIGGETLNPWGYDRDNGQGAAERAVELAKS